MTSAKIICDSINEYGDRLTTFVLTYPRFIHAQFMTHRVFSRNAASSRAIPVAKMIAAVEDNPVEPVYWGKNQKGMQASEEVSEEIKKELRTEWLDAAKYAVRKARRMLELGCHKQIANRLLEPFSYITTVCTATDYQNWFALRCADDAQPEITSLSIAMLDQYVNNKPQFLRSGEWHLPFGDKHVSKNISVDNLIKICIARCARVSYLSFDGDIDEEKDYKLYNSLLADGHMSPFEHVAYAHKRRIQSGNFLGFIQFRKTIANECRHLTVGQLRALLESKK